ncbi:MAG: methionyl-tRNA formyltransferase, partial [Burkholderiales bacterium]|nr:methionyl-tRNA formyltransferase [Burkholderiales bacterium]
PGQILSANAEQGVIVACGQGSLGLTELQKPGGKRLLATDFLQGFALKEGHFFS